MTRPPCWSLVGVVPLLAVVGLALLGGCRQRSGCEEACARVAACKKAAQEGDPILGDKKMPPDPACLEKCETKPDDFATCEAIKRSCAELRDCRGAF